MFCNVRLEVELPYSSSLKDKRQTVRSIKDRLRRRNVSIVESDRQDSWQRAVMELTFAAISAGAAEEKRNEVRAMLLGYPEMVISTWQEDFSNL
ncbi:DUF503 domain-containing protein [Rubrobacter indicoceani]|uniref:DUF503 domain-containing protein n=1 Tax=Rubrobacter indicoceani TaxID=2051957 RepID=UPI000E5A3F93|nr:DUF503 domain-containing protein [Rubrobacter indicoceani]